MFVRTPAIFFDTPADQGGGEVAPAADGTPAAAAPEPTTPESAPAEGTPPAEGAAPAAAEATPVNWEERVTKEWGGEEAVQRALAVDRALDTREGLEALVKALPPEVLQEILGTSEAPAAAGEQPETVEQLLADPDRMLTAGEISRVLAHNAAQQSSQQQSAQRIQVIQSALNTTLDDLKVEGTERGIVLDLADQFLPKVLPGQSADQVFASNPDAVKAAIRRGHEAYQAQVKAAAEKYLTDKGAAHDALPTPLSGGTPGGGGADAAPVTWDEARARARKALGGE